MAASAKRSLITTPIFYVNASPHLGHLYSALLADARARWQRLCGDDVLFSTGTDEHGSKVQEAAMKKKQTPQKFCDDVSAEFKNLFDKANLSYNRFIRTTEPSHKESVHHFWRLLRDRGHIYMGQHEGWYCTSDETFVTESQVVDAVDGHGKPCKKTQSGHAVEWVKEDNYKFRLSAFQTQLERHFDAHKNFVTPPLRWKESRAAISAGLQDLSVSRPTKRVSWGIAVPDDPEHTVYVWLDALTNYLTVSGYPQHPQGEPFWPAMTHFLGKDILRFHAVYFPAFLLAAGLPLPQQLCAHAHWTVDKVKMSKSLGNVVDPFKLIDSYGVDSVRYFLLREGALEDDGDFTLKSLANRINADLADNLGNLMLRTASPLLLPGKMICQPGPLEAGDSQLIRLLHDLPAIVGGHYENNDFRSGLNQISETLSSVNGYFTRNAPWELVKTNQQERANTVMYVTLEAVRIAALLLQPIIPESSHRMLTFLGVPVSQRSVSNIVYGRTPGEPIGDGLPRIFSKIKL